MTEHRLITELRSWIDQMDFIREDMGFPSNEASPHITAELRDLEVIRIMEVYVSGLPHTASSVYSNVGRTMIDAYRTLLQTTDELTGETIVNREKLRSAFEARLPHMTKRLGIKDLHLYSDEDQFECMAELIFSHELYTIAHRERDRIRSTFGHSVSSELN